MRDVIWIAIAASVLLGAAAPAPAPDEWVIVDAGGVFSFTAPATLKWDETLKPIDSFARSYDSEHFGLMFDYGPYTSAFGEDAVSSSRFTAPAKLERLMIDGRRAQVLTGPGDGSGNCDFISDLFVAGPTKAENLSMTSCGDAEGMRQVRRLYESIKFAGRP